MSLYTGAYFESWVKFLERLLLTFKLERILGSEIGYAHGTCFPKSQINQCIISLAQSS